MAHGVKREFGRKKTNQKVAKHENRNKNDEVDTLSCLFSAQLAVHVLRQNIADPLTIHVGYNKDANLTNHTESIVSF